MNRIRALAAVCALPCLAALFPLVAQPLLGPDGNFYPDWRHAGVPGGIPNPAVVTSITAHGGVADDGLDDAAALESAAAAAAAAGGGVVTLPAGVFHLDRPVIIKGDGVVLRGAGREATRLVFRYMPPTNDVTFHRPPAGTVNLYANTWIEAHADPVGLNEIAIYAKNAGAPDSTRQLCVIMSKSGGGGFWGATYSVRTNGGTVFSKVGTGSKELIAEAKYDDGTVRVQRSTYTVYSSSNPATTPAPTTLGAITFCGVGVDAPNRLLTQSGLRGQTVLSLASGHGLVAGDDLEIQAPNTTRWNDEVDNSANGFFRVAQYRVVASTATSVTIDRPLRIDFPLVDAPYVRRLRMITGGGVESLTLEQTNDLWTSGIIFSWARACWVRDVRVEKAGRFPVYFRPARHCEVRDSIFDDAWYKGNGGTAYVGFERAYDCLMDNVTTYKMRHAPLVQWSAAGNVIRNSAFYDSDAHWHAGWSHENLFENCVITANRGYGSYGYGMWSSAPGDAAHGPNGPRNVVYNCDVSSPFDALWLGGMNRDWIIRDNRFSVDRGAGLYAQWNSGGHVIENNVFVFGASAGGVELADADCKDVELIGNHFVGLPDAAIALGQVAPALEVGNTAEDLLVPATFENAGFEDDFTGWTVSASDNGMSVISTAAAFSGAKGLRVTDTSTSAASSVYSPVFAVTPGRVYSARAYYRVHAGKNGLSLFLQFRDATNTLLLSTPITLGDNAGWRQAQVVETAPAGATTARIWVRSHGAAVTTVDLDDFSFGELEQQIPNPGFELGGQAWVNAGDGGMSQVTAAAARTGALGLRVTDTSTTAGSSYASSKLPAQEGRTYQARFWSRVISGSGVGVYLQFHGPTGTTLASTPMIAPVSGAWSESSFSAVAPPGTATVRIWVRAFIASVVTADFDDFTLLELPERPTPIVPSIYAWQHDPVYPFPNAGFEDGLTGWTNPGDGGMSVSSTEAAKTGERGLRVTDTSTTAGSSLYSPHFPVVEGGSYKVDYDVRLVSGSGIAVYLVFYDASGASVPGTHVHGIPAGTTSWTARSFVKEAPADAVSARIWVHSYNASIVTADFDNFRFSAVFD